MGYEWTLNTCEIQLRCKTGTLASGADAVKSYTFGGASTDANATAILSFKDAISSLIVNPVIECLQNRNYLAVEVEEG